MWAGSKLSWPGWARPSGPLAHGGPRGNAPKPRQRPRLLPMLLLVTLWVNGCAVTTQTAPPPPRPTLESLMPTTDGGITMNGQDAAELLRYLDQLERR